MLSPVPVVAFFDLDRTVLSVNSARFWVREEFKAGRIGGLRLFKAMSSGLKYHFGGRIEEALREAIASLKGEEEKELELRTQEFFRDQLAGRIRPQALKVLEDHRDRGHHRVLLTSATSYLADIVVEELGFEGRLSTVLEVDQAGCLTGNPTEPLCYGEGKLTLGCDYLQKVGARLEESYFYTDSMSDWEMLAAVGNPVVVNPDIRLGRAARREGWEIVDWGVPAS